MITGFVARFRDRQAFHIRWLFHLDQYSGLESNFNQNLRQALVVSEQFDEFELYVSRINRGFEGTLKKMMGVVCRDVLWIEDDWRWNHDFWLGQIIKTVREQRADGFDFSNQRQRVGSVCPSFWTLNKVCFLRDNWPQPTKYGGRDRVSFTDFELKSVFRKTSFRHARVPAIPRRLCTEVGAHWFRSRGHKENHAGQNLAVRSWRGRKRTKEITA
jgi:hypothetical protein